MNSCVIVVAHTNLYGLTLICVPNDASAAVTAPLSATSADVGSAFSMVTVRLLSIVVILASERSADAC